MQIVISMDRWGFPRGTAFPFLLLRADNWDDFGFKTSYHLEYWTSENDQTDIGMVKIMRRGLATANQVISLPNDRDLRLGDDYCSLGQRTSYYETLLEHLGIAETKDYLERMQDVALHPEREAIFRNEPAFHTSLLREGGARRALEDASDLLAGHDLDEGLSFGFATNVGGEPFRVDFRFGESELIPSRINAVIGYNGVGKTRLMANLAQVAWRDLASREEHEEAFGALIPSSMAFGRVVAISYSAFDTFSIPSASKEYVYCGLRDASSETEGRLKSTGEIAWELTKALNRLRTEDRWQALSGALAPLFREPSFQLSSTMLDFREEESEWRPVFDALSTGHKISLNIVVQLVSQLENKSLVLIDEPESHLHPPLLAALMKGVTEALRETNSFAIVATHSPVVLQEISSKHVQVLRRYGNVTKVERPRTETFGENVGILTRSVFDLDNTDADYEGVLRSLGSSIGVAGLSEIFPDGLSSQALAIVMEAEARARAEATDDEF